MRSILFACALALIAVTSAAAHEFWIGARDAALAPGETLVADLLQGQRFKGNRLRYLPPRFERFDVVGPNGAVPVASRLGDRPALQQALAEPGLHVVVYVGRTQRTGYFRLADFAEAVAYEGFGDAAARHRARDLPEKGFSEAYTRYAKALVRVAPAGMGEADMAADRRIGLPIELVFLDPPHAVPAPASARVRLLLGGEPMAGAQLRVFSRSLAADPSVAAAEVVLRTDGRGDALVPLDPARRYLVSAVHLREPSAALAAERDVVWETLWASTSFHTSSLAGVE